MPKTMRSEFLKKNRFQSIPLIIPAPATVGAGAGEVWLFLRHLEACWFLRECFISHVATNFSIRRTEAM
jgi:hypothetical protein